MWSSANFDRFLSTLRRRCDFKISRFHRNFEVWEGESYSKLVQKISFWALKLSTFLFHLSKRIGDMSKAEHSHSTQVCARLREKRQRIRKNLAKLPILASFLAKGWLTLNPPLFVHFTNFSIPWAKTELFFLIYQYSPCFLFLFRTLWSLSLD